MPMNPSGGLAGLVAALQGGMDPNQAFGIMQYLQGEQQDRIAQRGARLGGLADLLTNAASGGMPYGGAQALAEVAPGPSGPAVENMLSALYPTAQPGEMSRGEAIMGGGAPAGPSPDAMSPTFAPQMQAPMGPLEQQSYAMNELEMQNQLTAQQDQAQAEAATTASVLAGIQRDAATAKASGKTPAEFIRDVMVVPDNALVLNQHEAEVGEILRQVWASPDVAASPWHAALGQ